MSKSAPMTLPPRQPTKGNAQTSVASIEAPVVFAPADPESTASGPTAATERTPLPPNVKALGGTIAVTVRMDQPTYERLKMYGVRTRQTNQDIVLNAIKATLDALDEVGRAGSPSQTGGKAG